MSDYIIPNYSLIYYTRAEIVAALSAVGFETHLDIMAAIGFAESSWSNAIQKYQPYSTTGWGCWQITPGNSEPRIGTDLQLLDLSVNARAARAKFDTQGLEAWSTYNSGIYQQYMNMQRGSEERGTMAVPTKAVCHPLTFVKDYDDPRSE